jgi:hypothetical protein
MHHIITEVIESKFVIGAIGNIGIIGFSALFAVGLVFINTIYGEAQPFKNGSVPLTVAAGQVIIYSNNM